MRHSLIFALGLLLAACSGISGNKGKETTSPDGRIRFAIDINDEGTALYSVMFDGETIIAPSALGLTTSECDYRTGLQLLDIDHSSHSEVWQPVWGQYAEIEDCYNAMTANFTTADDRKLALEVRLYNDGVGMRYTLDGEGEVDILNEQTEFAAAADYEVHWIAGSYDDDEYAYMHTLLSGITDRKSVV